MRYLILSIIVLAMVAYGCDDGAQHGQYAVSGRSSRTLAKTTGSVTIVEGYPQPVSQQTPNRQALLYVLCLAPSMEASGSSFSGSDQKYVSTIKESWRTDQGDVGIDLSWDRRTDTVSAGGATFNRAKGNAFVLLRDAAGKVSATQVGPIDAGLDPFVALEQMQAALPAESPGKTVALVR